MNRSLPLTLLLCLFSQQPSLRGGALRKLQNVFATANPGSNFGPQQNFFLPNRNQIAPVPNSFPSISVTLPSVFAVPSRLPNGLPYPRSPKIPAAPPVPANFFGTSLKVVTP
jgi:hypothetical protein